MMRQHCKQENEDSWEEYVLVYNKAIRAKYYPSSGSAPPCKAATAIKEDIAAANMPADNAAVR